MSAKSTGDSPAATPASNFGTYTQCFRSDDLLETSEELLPARNVAWIVRSLGERGILAAIDAVLLARPPVSDHSQRPPAQDRARLRAEQRDTVFDVVGRYNPEAVVCVGIPFGHTRPQWILPHGGTMTVDGTQQRVFAGYT